MTVPPAARRSLNRCNLPTEALGSFAFQLAPCALSLDGVLPLHQPLFDRLNMLDAAQERARLFRTYMNAHFMLDDAPALGLSENVRLDRSKMDYLRLLRGWLFDAESREGAILKAWVESRFGRLTRYHRGPREDEDGAARSGFDQEAAAGLYSTAGLESQVDLLYAWTQYELARRLPARTHLPLYRGSSALRALRVMTTLDDGRRVVALNNLSSFSASPERADVFGDRVFSCATPLPKILAFSGLIPGLLQGENEYLVIGGVVAVTVEY
jgi:NAD+--dinitrogen-reductase ADP-D-ribosyltransferase